MRLKIATFIFVLGLSLNVQAQDNVMVDLSVLNGLSSSYVAPSEPMFPVLPKQSVRPHQRPKKVVSRPKVVKEAKKENLVQPSEKKVVEEKVMTKEIQQEPEENIVVVDVEPVGPVEPVEPAVENKPEEIKATKPYEAEKIIAEPTKPVTVEETSHVSPTTAETQQEQEAVAPVEQKEVLTSDAEEKTEEAQKTEQEPVQNIVTGKAITFESGVSDLTPEQLAQIDDIIGRFSDANANKIAIHSYNVDDGVDTFRKKRISLKRAIEIRSYLLQQGYKNFSIKVININSDSDKANTVELEEI